MDNLKRLLNDRKFKFYFILQNEFYFRENIAEEFSTEMKIRDNLSSKMPSLWGPFSSMMANHSSLCSIAIIVAIINFITVYRATRRTADPISSPRQPHSGIITQDAKRYLGRCLSRYSFMALSKCVSRCPC